MKPTHTKYNPRTHHMYPLSQHISCRPVCADTGKSTKRHDKQRLVNNAWTQQQSATLQRTPTEITILICGQQKSTHHPQAA